MATHGCIRCSKCGSGCPLCGRCACERTNDPTYDMRWTWLVDTSDPDSIGSLNLGEDDDS